MKVLFLTNSPAPYREKIHDLVCSRLNDNYYVVYCKSVEKNRDWKFSTGSYNKVFLKAQSIFLGSKTIYFFSNITAVLNEINPDVVIVSGFSLPMIKAYGWSLLKNKKIVSFSDANIHSELNLSFLHKWVRKFFYGKSDAFIGICEKTFHLFSLFGAKRQQFFQSHLCADNERFLKHNHDFKSRPYDILLCGQMIPRKMFDFSIDVITCLLSRQPNLRIKVLGSGPLQQHILNRLDAIGVKYDYPGYVSQEDLPEHYGSSKLFFFPSNRDPWGVVANEACATGTPVLTCPVVGAADELIIHGSNGYVLDPKVDVWADHAFKLLTDEPCWQRLSRSCINKVSAYNYDNAAQGILDASHYVMQHDNQAFNGAG